MPVIRIKLKNPSDAVYFQSIFGTYAHVAWVRTEDPINQIISVIPTSDTLETAIEVLESLKPEIEFSPA
ncbi:MAG: hypothetical protein ACT4NX_07615 [Deltaproteobacteria bacterium]